MKKVFFTLCLAAAVAAGGGCKKKDDAASGGPSCADVGANMKKQMGAKVTEGMEGDQKKAAEAALTEAVAIAAKHCKDDKWSADAIKCASTSADPKKDCDGKITDDQKAKMKDEMAAAMMKAMAAAQPAEPTKEPEPAAGSGSASSAPAGEVKEGDGNVAGEAKEGAEEGKEEAKEGDSTGLPNCDAYIEAVEKYVACDKVPQQARDGVKSGLDSMKSGWASMKDVPDDVKKQTDDACKQAVDGLKQGASALGCEI